MTFSKGDIVRVNLNPVRGHEQGKNRPVLVINSVPLPGGMNLVLPITSKKKTYPLEVKLDNRTITQGIVLCFQIRAIDLKKRKGEFIEKAPIDITETCSDYVHRLVDKPF